MVAEVKSCSTKSGIAVPRLLVGRIPSQAGGGEDTVWAQEEPEGIALQRGKIQPPAASSEQPLGSCLWALTSAADGWCFASVSKTPARSFQAFSVQLFDYKEEGRGSMVVLQRREKEG